MPRSTLKPPFSRRSVISAGGLELLHAELAEIEDVVAGERDRLGVAVDVVEDEALLGREVVAAAHVCSSLLVMPRSRASTSFAPSTWMPDKPA